MGSILEWRLRRRLGMMASTPALQQMSAFAQSVFERERALADNV